MPDDRTNTPVLEPSAPAPVTTEEPEDLLDEDLILEEITIDGICGVY